MDGGILGATSPRVGLLWALESLAWKKQNFPRSVKILVQLSQFEIDDNLENKPFNSLKAIFRSWMPQTSATVEERLIVLKSLITSYPDVCWRLCTTQINQRDRVGSSSYKPMWRDDAIGSGEVKTYGEIQQFNREVLNILVSWDYHNEKTLGELLESIHLIPKDDQDKIWELINDWSKNANDFSKAEIRENIRNLAFSRSSIHKDLGDSLIDSAQELYRKLQPKNIVIRHKWLYIKEWLQPFISNEEILDVVETKGNIDTLRHAAIDEIWNEKGFKGIEELLTYSESTNVIGRYVSKNISDFDVRMAFILGALSMTDNLEDKWRKCLEGFLLELSPEILSEVLSKLAIDLEEKNQKRLVKCLPFDLNTWKHLELFNEATQLHYWENTNVYVVEDESADLLTVVDYLLKAERPSAALYTISNNLNEFNSPYLEGILRALAMGENNMKDDVSLENNIIVRTLQAINQKRDIDDERLAQLEFLYINRLDNTSYEFPGIERLNAKSPALFMELITLIYKSENYTSEESNPEEFEREQLLGMLATRLLKKLRTIPGIEDDNIVNSQKLRDWIMDARQQAIAIRRSDVTDMCIGELLSKSPRNTDGTWPQQGVCIVLEELSSSKIRTGIRIGILNSRGVVLRGPDGEQERQLADLYYNWAEKLYFEFPYVGNLLEEVARTYDGEAVHVDAEEETEKRLLE